MNQEQKQLVARMIGARVAYYRSLLGMTQKDMANALFVSPSTISKIEQGKYLNSLSISHLLDISELFGISPSALLHSNTQDRDLLHKLLEDYGKTTKVP